MNVTTSRTPIIAALCAGLVTMGIIITVNVNRQYIDDQIAVWNFAATPELLALESKLELTERARFIFRASHPAIEPRRQFNARCATVQHKENEHLLGCYAQSRIYIFEIDDPRLNGIMEVTAAHELLHAAHARLSTAERNTINAMLQDVYREASAHDPALTERMSVYQALSDTSFSNELHSVLGTEMAQLPEALEAHYAELFENRSTIVEHFSHYNEIFAQMREQAQRIEASMSTLAGTISNDKQRYEHTMATLDADISQFNRRAQQGDFTSFSAFQRESGQLQRRIDALERDRQAIETLVQQYNAQREELLVLDSQSQELNRVLNSSIEPAPQL